MRCSRNDFQTLTLTMTMTMTRLSAIQRMMLSELGLGATLTIGWHNARLNAFIKPVSSPKIAKQGRGGTTAHRGVRLTI